MIVYKFLIFYFIGMYMNALALGIIAQMTISYDDLDAYEKFAIVILWPLLDVITFVIWIWLFFKDYCHIPWVNAISLPFRPYSLGKKIGTWFSKKRSNNK